MKRIKLAITGILVLAVVSGAVAFKTFNPANVYCPDAQGKCNQLSNFTSTNTGIDETNNPCNDNLTLHKFLIATSPSSSPCPTQSASLNVWEQDAD